MSREHSAEDRGLRAEDRGTRFPLTADRTIILREGQGVLMQAPGIRLHYEWHEGSLPPPHHYEYRLEVSGDEGRIEFSPDYPGDGRPKWIEPFVVDLDLVTRIVARLEEEGLLRNRWDRESGRSSVGGSVDWLEIELDGERYTIPSWVVRADDRAREIIVEIRSLVPEPLWDDLMRRRREYEEAWVG